MHSQPDRLGKFDARRDALSIIRDHEFQQTVRHAPELHPHRSRTGLAEGMPQRVADQFGNDQAQRKRQIGGQFNGLRLDLKGLMRLLDAKGIDDLLADLRRGTGPS